MGVPGTGARIRLIKVRIRGASWKWNYRGVVGGRDSALRTPHSALRSPHSVRSTFLCGAAEGVERSFPARSVPLPPPGRGWRPSREGKGQLGAAARCNSLRL